jgi:hypothetical protein
MSDQTPQPPKGVPDLMAATGLGRDLVKAAILSGELPGHKIGNRYVVPAEAFERFCRGEWVPTYRPVFTERIKPTAKPKPADFRKRIAS